MATRSAAQEERRRQILAAAVRAFAKKGYHACRVSDIAEEAGVAYGLVYHYFESKDAVLEAVFREMWGMMLAAINAVGEGDDPPREQLRKACAIVLRTWRDYPDVVRVLVREVARSGDQLQREVEEIALAFEAIERIVARGQEQKVFRADLSPRLAAWIVYGALEEILTGWVLGRLAGDEDEIREAERDRGRDPLRRVGGALETGLRCLSEPGSGQSSRLRLRPLACSAGSRRFPRRRAGDCRSNNMVRRNELGPGGPEAGSPRRGARSRSSTRTRRTRLDRFVATASPIAELTSRRSTPGGGSRIRPGRCGSTCTRSAVARRARGARRRRPTLAHPSSFYATEPTFSKILGDLTSVPYRATNTQRRYLVYWDAATPNPRVCGQGGGSGVGAGYAIVYMQACGATVGDGNLAAVIAAHELVHALGAVPPGAPHECRAAERRTRLRRHDRHPLPVPQLRPRPADPRRQPRRLRRHRNLDGHSELTVARISTRPRSR